MTGLLAVVLAGLVAGDAVVAATAVGHAVVHGRPAAAAPAADDLNVRSPLIRAEIRRAARSMRRATTVTRRMSARSPARVDLDVTAYCATGSPTASGGWPHAGQAAGNRWPFGTRLVVPGIGVVTVTDRIGWGSDLDLYFGDRPDCAAAASVWGRQRLAVEVVR